MNWLQRRYARKLAAGLSAAMGLILICFGAFSAVWIAALCGMGLAFLLAFLMARQVTAPMNRITQALRAAAEGTLNQRVPVESEDEVGELAAAFNRMAEKLETAMAQLTLEKEEVKAVLGSMVEHVIAVDSQGKIMLLNPAAETLFQSRQDEAAGRVFLEISRQAAVNELLQSVLQTRSEKFQEIRLFLPEERFLEARAIPLKDRSDQWGALLVLHDITRLQLLEHLRKEFVANVSHELRTPLTSIQGFAETLLSGALDDAKHNRDFVESIQNQAQHLTRLVDDLLDLSAIESGRRKPAPVPVSIPKLFRQIEESFKAQALKQDVRLQLQIPQDLPEIQADPHQLQQVFTNLLDNAIKFNRRGGRVEVTASSDAGSVTFSIADTGIGIPEEDLPRIFERFYRVDKARSREMGGTGLGLAIVKHIVEAHRGNIRVESSPDEGTVFHITLPLSAS